MLGIGGVVAIVLFIRHHGADVVWAALQRALPWLPLLIALEVGWIAADLLVWRSFLGHKRAGRVPLRAWLRGSLLAYFVMIVLPAGRAGGDAARATVFARHIGKSAAAAGCVHSIGAGLVGNALISVPCVIASGVTLGWAEPLTLLIAGNGLLTLGLGTTTILWPRKLGIGRWMSRRAGLEAVDNAFDHMWQRSLMLSVKAVLWSGLGRAVQVGLIATVLLALGEVPGLERALLSEGIYLVSAALGDVAPNQLGVTEGAFVAFGDQLSLQHLESPLTIALLIRMIQLTVGILAFIAASMLGRPPDAAGDESQPNNSRSGRRTPCEPPQ